MAASSTEETRFTIGCALSSKKQNTVINPSLLSLASSRGLNLIPIDPSIPISSQSRHLDVIVHKLYDDAWVSNLDEFASENPSVLVIDPPGLIKRVQDRISMARFVAELKVPSNPEVNSDRRLQNQHPCTFGIPEQIIVHDTATLNDPAILAGLRFPVIAKPLAADGSSKSHKMALVFNHKGLLKQNPPLVFQEFVNHGGVVFKVYVAGDYTKCVKRKSIPDLSGERLATFEQGGFVSFSQISNMTVAENEVDVMKMPPENFVTEIARGLRTAMGLNLFNFDMIRDERIGNHYLIIDINYFPGYEKLPGYETMLTDFLWSLVHKEQEDGSGSAVGGDDEKLKHRTGSSDNDEEVEKVG
ncbi:uncharacterized protein A4U43_C08F1460 [Asparagus officinalis]|uniref:inositol-tetrakisphosphate 1-kinase 5-like n=1 Tax=Asparagus officinalis TaxID=4686 RepID=UPI00098E7ECA|nr:inositol-tetrakisphosphate 1-kinase 5-like [Asparagus officinalis]ONK58956.1 uncharacterized protein A4U43_C08F1460 [Asparagus officinalis]